MVTRSSLCIQLQQFDILAYTVYLSARRTMLRTRPALLCVVRIASHALRALHLSLAHVIAVLAVLGACCNTHHCCFGVFFYTKNLSIYISYLHIQVSGEEN